MAIVEVDATLTQLMHKLGCSLDLIVAVETAKLVASYDMKGVTVSLSSESPVSTLDVGISQIAGIKIGVLQMIINGTLPGEAAKNLAKIQLEKAVKHVLNATTVKIGEPQFLKPAHESPPPHFEVEIEQPQTPFEVSPEVAEVFGQSKPKVKSEIDLEQELEGEVFQSPKPGTKKIKLAGAAALYQPVAGSDADSVYFAIAISPALNVAVRVKGGKTVSIRAEGPGLASMKATLKAAGLNINEGYCSMHLTAETPDLARKSIGAVLFGIGHAFKLMTCDLEPIWNKGV